jgi:primosomal protein N'
VPETEAEGPSSVRDRVILLVNESEGGLTTPQLLERFRERWRVDVPVATLNSALSRAAKANSIERLSHGRYGPVRPASPGEGAS